MSKWLEPSGYFGPYFGTEGEAVIRAHATFSITATGSLTGEGSLTDRQAFRIYNLRKNKRKPRAELVLDMDVSGVPEREETPVLKPIQAQIIPSGKPLRVTALDRLMVAPIQIRVRPKPVFRAPILPLIVQKDVEEERKTRRNKTIRLLLLAS